MIYALTWVIVFANVGVVSVGLWAAIKLVIPFIGFILLLWALIGLIKYRKEKMIQYVFRVIISALLIFPILLTMNVIHMAYPANINEVKPAVTISWPLTEETVVGWGGNEYEDNVPHAMWGSELWAYDLVMEPYNTGSDDLTSYGIWDKEVVSPAKGIVIAAHDDEKDIQLNTEENETTLGNYVFIKLEETGTYIVLVHLKQDSVVVSAGDVVEPGDVIGHVGNSGSTSEPHLHIHHQREDPTKMLSTLLAEGLPLYFDTLPDNPMPTRGTTVEIN